MRRPCSVTRQKNAPRERGTSSLREETLANKSAGYLLLTPVVWIGADLSTRGMLVLSATSLS